MKGPFLIEDQYLIKYQYIIKDNLIKNHCRSIIVAKSEINKISLFLLAHPN